MVQGADESIRPLAIQTAFSFMLLDVLSEGMCV